MLRVGRHAGKIFAVETGVPVCRSWFLSPPRENFRLTDEAKATFTEKGYRRSRARRAIDGPATERNQSPQ